MRYRIAPPCHRYFIHYQRLLTTQNDERVQAAIPIVIMACVDCVACERVYTRTEYKTLHTHSHTSCIARAPDASSTAFSPTRRNELIYTNGDFCQLANYHLSTTSTQPLTCEPPSDSFSRGTHLVVINILPSLNSRKKSSLFTS